MNIKKITVYFLVIMVTPSPLYHSFTIKLIYCIMKGHYSQSQSSSLLFLSLMCSCIVYISYNPDVEKRDSDATGSFAESSQDSQDSFYILECEIKSFSGCNLVTEKCACSEDVRTCINPFQFAGLDECRQVVRVQNGSITPAGKIQALLKSA